MTGGETREVVGRHDVGDRVRQADERQHQWRHDEQAGQGENEDEAIGAAAVVVTQLGSDPPDQTGRRKLGRARRGRGVQIDERLDRTTRSVTRRVVARASLPCVVPPHARSVRARAPRLAHPFQSDTPSASMGGVMGHAGMAAAAVRYLRSVEAAPERKPVEVLPRPELRCVGEDERAPVGPAEFRRVLGNFATGVAVVTAPAPTTTTNDPQAAPPAPAGFACQSFSSLSLDPPLIAFMVGRTSTTWPRIARAGTFCVNVLSAGQGELCRAFAVSGADKFAGVAYDAAPVSGAPRLAGTLAWIDCTIHAVHTGGDHLIVVGRVDALGASGGDEAPLLFHKGRFL